ATALVFDLFVGFYYFQAEDGIRDFHVTGVQTCALPICVLVVVITVTDAEITGNTTTSTPALGGGVQVLAETGASVTFTRTLIGGDRKSVVQGKSVDLRCRRIIQLDKQAGNEKSGVDM